MTDSADSTSARPPQRHPIRRAALLSLLVISVAFLWMFISTLTARPSPDPTVYDRVLGLTREAQRDPAASSRYQELGISVDEAALTLDRIETIAKYEVADMGPRDLDLYNVVDFTALLAHEPDDRSPETIAIHSRYALDAIEQLETRGDFSRIAAILRHPNLANTYTGGYDEQAQRLPIYFWELPELSPMRRLSLVQAARIRIALAEGNPDLAATLLAEFAPLPGVLTRQATVIEHLVGYAIADVLLTEAQHIAGHSGLTAQGVGTLRRAMESLADLGAPSIAIEGERLSYLDVHNQTHTRSGRFIPSRYRSLMIDLGLSHENGPQTTLHHILGAFSDMRGYVQVSRSTSLSIGDRYYDMLLEAIGEADPERRASLLSESDAMAGRLGFRSELAAVSLPALSRFAQRWFELNRAITATECMVAMAGYRLDHGEWPETIDALVPRYLDRIPLDPVTGQAMEYRHVAGEAPSLESLGIESRS